MSMDVTEAPPPVVVSEPAPAADPAPATEQPVETQGQLAPQELKGQSVFEESGSAPRKAVDLSGGGGGNDFAGVQTFSVQDLLRGSGALEIQRYGVEAAGRPYYEDTPLVQSADRAVAAAEIELANAQQALDTANDTGSGPAIASASERVCLARTDLEAMKQVRELRLAEADLQHFKSMGPAYAAETAKAQAAFNQLATPVNIAYDVRLATRDLSKSGAGASTLMQGTVMRAVGLLNLDGKMKKADGTLDGQKVMDNAMAITAKVLLGSYADKSMDIARGFLNLVGMSENDMAHFNQMDTLIKALPKEVWAGDNLDTTKGKDLRDSFNDGSMNQAFHCMAFVMLGYSMPTNNMSKWIAVAGNIVHETLQETNGGGSAQDFMASQAGLRIGFNLQEVARPQAARDSWVPNALPAILGSTFAKPGDDYRLVDSLSQYMINGEPQDFRGLGRQINDNIMKNLGVSDAWGLVFVGWWNGQI